MTINETFNLIRKRFNDEVATPESLITQYDNNKVDNPDNTLWCRFSILPGASRQVSGGSPGSNRKRAVGVAVAQLFTPYGKGTEAAELLAEIIKGKFESLSVSTIIFRTPSITVVGRTNDGDEWQINVNCPFQVDNIN